jgi:hypothetical protein
MNSSSEKDLLKRTAEKFERKGYKIFYEPSSYVYPFDLGSYRPDLLAIKNDNDGYIFEIKSSKSKVSVDELKEIASSTDSHEGWHFVLVTGDDITLEQQDIASEKPILSWKQIYSEIEKAKRLLQNKEDESSFIISMRIIEAILRKHSDDKSIPIERLPITSIINHLYSLGELSFEQLEKIRKLQKLRNQIVHGFQIKLYRTNINLAFNLIDEFLETYNSNNK